MFTKVLMEHGVIGKLYEYQFITIEHSPICFHVKLQFPARCMDDRDSQEIVREHLVSLLAMIRTSSAKIRTQLDWKQLDHVHC